jgi:hypothetical protein
VVVDEGEDEIFRSRFAAQGEASLGRLVLLAAPGGARIYAVE